MNPKLPNLPVVAMTVYLHKWEKNRRFKAYDVEVVAQPIKVQPIGGDGLEDGGIYPVPRIVKETEDMLYVEYKGTGMGDGKWKMEYYRTPEAARRGALKWLNGAPELTEEQKVEIYRTEKVKARKELVERIAHQKVKIAEAEANVERLKKELGA